MGVDWVPQESKKIKKIRCVDFNISINRHIIRDKRWDILTKKEWEYTK